jgi:uncharacterized phiE125 gp8 family phage protein
MTQFIAAARAQVEQDTGLALLTQTREVTLVVPVSGGTVPLPPHCTPLQEITELTASPAIGSSARLVLDPRVHLQVGTSGSVTFLSWPADAGIATLRVIAGWPDRAALLAEVPLLIQAVGLLTAHFATLGRDLASGTPATKVRMGYDEAIEPYRLVWVT